MKSTFNLFAPVTRQVRFRFARLLCISLALGVMQTARCATAADDAFPKKTFVYKTVDDIEIKADVYRPDDKKLRPIVVWLHGGALIVGSREGVPRRLLDLCREEGYVLVSFDYRLAPEVKSPEIIEDLKDSFRWLYVKAPERFAGDPKRIVVCGGSAGGHLTMMTGIVVRPRPLALVAYWGYGDVDGDWLTKPSEYYRNSTPPIPREEALAAVGKGVLTGTSGRTPAGAARGRYYRYLRQNGLWTKEVTGFDPEKDRGKLDMYCPVRNINEEYPPILMVHGTDDNDVPYSKSADMAKELKRHGVTHELVTVPGGGHGLARADKQLVEQAHAKALEFIRQHLK